MTGMNQNKFQIIDYVSRLWFYLYLKGHYGMMNIVPSGTTLAASKMFDLIFIINHCRIVCSNQNFLSASHREGSLSSFGSQNF